jgi:hypothetical protein
MIVKLTDDEIREALAKTLMAKIKYSGDAINPDDCWFECCSEGEEVEDISSVCFVWDEDNE